MDSDNNSFSLGKHLLVVVGVSIVGALACVGAQLLIAGEDLPGHHRGRCWCGSRDDDSATEKAPPRG